MADSQHSYWTEDFAHGPSQVYCPTCAKLLEVYRRMQGSWGYRACAECRPAAGVALRLIVVRGEPADHCLDFTPGEYLVGRSGACNLCVDGVQISRRHCALLVADTGASVRDLGSTNGTFVNGVRVEC